MATAFSWRQDTTPRRQRVLAEQNIHFLRQGLALLARLDDAGYPIIGPHYRHILEHYQCFLDGIGGDHVDYTARRREAWIEKERATAMARTRTLVERLRCAPALNTDPIIWVQMEDPGGCDAEQRWIVSTVSRELQYLASHTVHHFALIALHLRDTGFQTDSDFGVAPSTLKHRAVQA